MTPIRVPLLAFLGMNRRLPASALRPSAPDQGAVLPPRELVGFRVHLLPLLVPREAIRHVNESSSQTSFPYGKTAQIIP